MARFSHGLGAMVIANAIFHYFEPMGQAACKIRRQSGYVKEGMGSKAYLWPSAMGQPGNYGNSKFAGPKNFTEAFSWKWQDPFGGRFKSGGAGGTVVDDKKNIYLSWNWGLTKFSPDGQTLWTYYPKGHCGTLDRESIWNSPSLWGDAVFASTEFGAVFAVNMETGAEVWSTQYMSSAYLMNLKWPRINNGFVQVSEGVVIVDFLAFVYGINAVNGKKLWQFEPDGGLWNFKADFPGDGTFVFQTYEGQVYRCRLTDGSVIWKSGGEIGTWTDGNVGLGPNNIVYGVNTKWTRPEPQPTKFDWAFTWQGEKGQLSAYALEDGKRLWTYDFERPPNNAMAIGRLSPGAPYSVIQPVGQQEKQGEQYWVYAFDAETGKLQWIFDGPIQKGRRQAMSDLSPSEQEGIHGGCIPNPWSAPTIDSTGTVYIGSQEGPIFALRDVNGDGRVEGGAEVQSYDTLRPYDGSEAPSIVPGLMAFASCDELYVFRYPEE